MKKSNTEGPESAGPNDEQNRIQSLEQENEELHQRIDRLESLVTTDAETESTVSDTESESQIDRSETEITASTETEPIAGQWQRRGVLATLGSLGVLGLGAGAGSVSASEDHDHLGETWSGDPADPGLTIEVNGEGIKAESDESIALWGESDEAGPMGRGMYGLATAESGDTRGIQGRADSPEGTGLLGVASADEGENAGLRGRTNSAEGNGVRAQNTANDDDAVAFEAVVPNADGGYGFKTPENVDIGGTLEVGGDLEVSGTKHFVQAVETTGGEKTVAYNAVEAGKAHTEVSDVAEMEDGKATVELPEHFEMVTSSDEPITVQVTPYANEPVRPQVVDRSTDRIVVEDFGDGPDDYAFAYTVKGVRHGFEDKEIVRDDD